MFYLVCLELHQSARSGWTATDLRCEIDAVCRKSKWNLNSMIINSQNYPRLTITYLLMNLKKERDWFLNFKSILFITDT